MLAATYAKQIGRVVAFSLAAFRQAFAGGRDLGERDSVLIAAAACEMHPAALIKGAGLGSIAGAAGRGDRERPPPGVLDVPAVVIDGRVFHGDRELEKAAAVRGVKANREYELSVRKAGRGPALLRGPGSADHVEVLEIATGEIALFWDTEPATDRPAGRGRCGPTSPSSRRPSSSRSGGAGRRSL